MSVLTLRPPRKWRVLPAGRDTAEAQMALDAQLAQQAGLTLRFFQWKRPSVSIGFKQRPPAWVHPATLARHGIESVERPTGGGVALHGSDLSCSVVAPHDPHWPLHELLEEIARALYDGIRRFGVEVEWVAGDAGGVPQAAGPATSRITYCLTQQSPYALMFGGRKLCGLAIRRYPSSWLIQGSLLVRGLPDVFADVMPAEVLASFQARAISLEQAAGRAIADEELTAALVQAWRTTWGIQNVYGLSTMDCGLAYDAL
jgi:lipoate-protein ligase A